MWEEIMPIDYEYLRRKARTIVEIPANYRLQLEDSTPKGAEIERSFIWEDPEDEDNIIEMSLDLESGQLRRLEIGYANKIEQVEGSTNAHSTEEARTIADGFLRQHAPDHASYSWVHLRRRLRNTYITYREEVGGLLLPSTGCNMVLNANLRISSFYLQRLGGSLSHRMEWPLAIASAEMVEHKIVSELYMQLTYALIDPSMYEMQGIEPEYRLVYEPILGHRSFDALTGEDLYGKDHYMMPTSHPFITEIGAEPCMPFDERLLDSVVWEKLLKVDTSMYTLDQQNDDGERIKFMYRLNKENNENKVGDSLTVDSYMKRKWGSVYSDFSDSIMIHIERSTGRLSGFHCMGGTEEQSDVRLSRAQCWEKAVQFLEIFFPDYHIYLQLEVDSDDSEEEHRRREFFYLPVYVDGIPVNHKRVTISISTYTGEVIVYMGVSYEMIKVLSECTQKATITAKEAYEQYVVNIRVKLEWTEDHKEDPSVYRLRYTSTTLKEDLPYDISHNMGLRYIDAVNGHLYWDKNH
jgi:hypothetical protein